MADRAEFPLYEVAGLTVTFATDRGPLQAVRGVDLEIHAGAVLGVVGESGSGKSVTALALVRLLPPHARATAGRLRFRGEDVTAMRPADLRRLRGGHVGMIFQEPARSFDPIYSIERSLAETLRTHHPDLQSEVVRDRSVRLLEEVGIPDAARRLASLPHQFSGGMLQRVMIAHALAAGPELLIADEPTTALDVTVQAQVVELLRRLRAARGLAILFISHDLALVSQVADRILVMYGGLVMEQGRGGDGARRTAPSLHARAAGSPPGTGRALHRPAVADHPRHRARSFASGAGLPVRAALRSGRSALRPRHTAVG